MLLVAASGVLGLVACGGDDGAAAPPTVTEAEPLIISGTVSAPVHWSEVVEANVGDFCVSAPGYDDVAVAAQVVIRDAAGKTVGLGALSAGSLAAPAGFEDNPGQAPVRDFRCEFRFNVPADSPSEYYSIVVGSGEHGETQVPADALDDRVEIFL